MLSVSVVVPCLNERAHVGALIDALRRQHLRPDEIIVVDGGSTDGTAALLEAVTAAVHDPRVRVLVRRGASIPEAVNAAVREAHGDVIVRLDAHAEPSDDYVARAVARLSDDRTGVVGGLWRVAPGAATTTAAAIARAVAHPLGAGDAAYRIGRHRTGTADVDTVPFGCFRRSVWERLGGLDESLLANEDYEFNYRVRRAGLRVILDSAIHSVYFARPTLGALARQYFRYGWWKAQMLRRHPASLRWRQAVPAAFAASLAALTAAGIVWPLAWGVLALLLGLYASVVFGTAYYICVIEHCWRSFLPLAGAFFVIHLAWGFATLVNALTFGTCPGRRRAVSGGPF